MAHLMNAVLTMPVWAVYVVVAALAFGESAAFVGLVLPGETALLLGGVVAATGRVSLPLMVVVGIVAAVLGDSVGYEIGRFGGAALRDSRAGRFVGEDRWRRAEAFVVRRGGLAVFTGRWVGLMRALVPALAGMTRMPYRRFLAFNAAGATLWATTVVVGGYIAGASWQRVQLYLGQAGVVLLIVVAGLAVAFVAGRWMVRHHAVIVGAGRRMVGHPAVRALLRRRHRPLAFAARRFRPGTAFGLGLTVGLGIVGVVTVVLTGAVRPCAGGRGHRDAGPAGHSVAHLRSTSSQTSGRSRCDRSDDPESVPVTPGPGRRTVPAPAPRRAAAGSGGGSAERTVAP